MTAIEGHLNTQACAKPAVFQKNKSMNASWCGALLLTALVSACGGGGGGREPVLGIGNGTAGPPILVAPPGSVNPGGGSVNPDGSVTPAPVTPAPVTPAPVSPAPVSPAPVTPAPVTPAPVTPAPVTPAPVTPAPVTPDPVTPVAPGTACLTAQPDAPTIIATSPTNGNQSVSTSTAGAPGGGKFVEATFSRDMNPPSLNNMTFSLAPTGFPAVTPTMVSYSVSTRVATLATPSALLSNTNYTVVIQGSATSSTGVPLGCGYTWIFKTANAPVVSLSPVNLGAAASFGGFGGNATITNDGLATVVNGDVGVNAASTKVTGFRDSGGNVYSITPNNNGLVTGVIYTLTAPPGSVAGAKVTQARIDALAAFDAISPGNLPGGLDVSNPAQCPSCGGALGGPDELAGRTLPPGVYKSATGTYDIGGPGRTSGNLVLDGKNDANAVWVFQSAAGTGTLNVGLTGPATPAVPVRVLLINGAQAKNVFWYAPAGAVIGTGSTMTGTMLSQAAITLSTTGGSPPTAVVTTLNGRAIALTAGVTMTNTVVNVPAP